MMNIGSKVIHILDTSQIPLEGVVTDVNDSYISVLWLGENKPATYHESKLKVQDNK